MHKEGINSKANIIKIPKRQYYMKAIIKKCLWLVILLLNGCASEMDLSQEKRPVLTVAGIVHICPENKITLIERGKEPYGGKPVYM